MYDSQWKFTKKVFKFIIHIRSESFTINYEPSLFLFVFLFSTLIIYYFEVCFGLNVILYIVEKMVSQNVCTSLLTIFQCSYGQFITWHADSPHRYTGHVYRVVCKLFESTDQEVSYSPVHNNTCGLVAVVKFIRNKKSYSWVVLVTVCAKPSDFDTRGCVWFCANVCWWFSGY